MKRIVPLVGLVLGLLVPGNAAKASGDYSCFPSWKLANPSFSTCTSSALLSPGNDTRVNLFYLLRDQRKAPAAGLSYPKEDWNDLGLGHNFFSWGMLRAAFFPASVKEDGTEDYTGSRCNSVAAGASAFGAALKANGKVSPGEREALTTARGQLAKRCSDAATAPAWPTEVKSAPGREFLAYLQAADAFYAEQWGASRQGFDQLRGARDPWVAETASYMLARVDLNAAQVNSFDEYGSFTGAEKADKAGFARARSELTDYLKRYGQGRYAASAQGLVRRTLWLSGDVAGLAREYTRLLGSVPATDVGAADLVQEVDSKLLVPIPGPGASGDSLDSPLLLATVDLMMMRKTDDEEGAAPTPVITAAQLAAQESRFAGRADLFSYLTASHAYYVRKDMAAVLRLIPDEAKRPSYAPLAFSRQMLRGMALAASHDRNEGGFWRELLGGANAVYQRPLVELALAMNYERSGKLADVFATGSPIGESAIREILLEYAAGPDLLRAQAKSAGRPAHERDLALFTLLYKQLTRGNYAAFTSDVALVPASAYVDTGVWNLQTQDKIPAGMFRAGTWSDGYACPALATTAGTLARNPRDVKARLCLGDFYRLNGLDGFEGAQEQPKPDELGGSPSQFAGKAIPRAAFYTDIIADPAAAGPDKAYALYRAVNCYAPSKSNACGGKDVDESVRKGWFQRLKRDFPTSEWAQKLRYYW